MRKIINIVIPLLFLLILSACLKTEKINILLLSRNEEEIERYADKGFIVKPLTEETADVFNQFNILDKMSYIRIRYYDILKYESMLNFNFEGEYLPIDEDKSFSDENYMFISLSDISFLEIAFPGLEMLDNIYNTSNINDFIDSFKGRVLLINEQLAEKCNLNVGDYVQLKHPVSGQAKNIRDHGIKRYTDRRGNIKNLNNDWEQDDIPIIFKNDEERQNDVEDVLHQDRDLYIIGGFYSLQSELVEKNTDFLSEDIIFIPYDAQSKQIKHNTVLGYEYRDNVIDYAIYQFKESVTQESINSYINTSLGTGAYNQFDYIILNN